ncbi:hypothetical protein ES703_29246 [subsurface metagenome]|jgi:septal ring factor EnvC (AmiA/AmiB activator)|nr:hypothetical protein [candidate division WOR-3 bacterium]
MNKLWIFLTLLLFFSGCEGKAPSERISKLQERIDAIAKKVEQGEGLKARKETEDIEISIKTLENKLDEIDKELKEINRRLDELNKKFTAHLEELH